MIEIVRSCDTGTASATTIATRTVEIQVAARRRRRRYTTPFEHCEVTLSTWSCARALPGHAPVTQPTLVKTPYDRPRGLRRLLDDLTGADDRAQQPPQPQVIDGHDHRGHQAPQPEQRKRDVGPVQHRQRQRA